VHLQQQQKKGSTDRVIGYRPGETNENARERKKTKTLSISTVFSKYCHRLRQLDLDPHVFAAADEPLFFFLSGYARPESLLIISVNKSPAASQPRGRPRLSALHIFFISVETLPRGAHDLTQFGGIPARLRLLLPVHQQILL